MKAFASIDEIGQSVCAELKASGIPRSPECFEVWFRYLQNANAELAREINDQRAARKPVDEDFILSLYYRYCERIDLAPVFDRYFDRVLDEVEGLKGVADGLSRSAQTFGEDVESLSADIERNGTSETELRGFIAALVETAAAATKRNQDLESKLSAAVDNIGKLRESIEEIEEDALTDFLTKLGNRRRFDKFIREAIAAADNDGARLSLIVCDIDHFKKFNDDFGHHVGDHVIKFVADILKKNIKGQDLAVRYGGEEFAITLPNTSLWDAQKLAEKIRATIARKKLVNRTGNQDLGSITVSFGVAEHEKGMSGEAFFEEADAALLDAKRSGRNKVIVRENLRLRTA